MESVARSTTPSITVELLGVARLLARCAELQVPYPPEATAGALLNAVASRLPALVGPVFVSDGGKLADGFVLSLDGKGWTRDPTTMLGGASRALLLSNVAGG
jgi:hypothetical protein